MGKKILFSPVGGTDPITNHHDGSLLHIIRNYQPDRIYLFLSKEMAECQQKDQRYTRSIDYLGQKQNKKYKYEIISKEELSEVQDYDVFYELFTELLSDIRIKEDMEEGDILYVNTASGTPAMKSALVVLTVLSENGYIPVQVSTPNKKINKDIREYDVETEWNGNKDNEAGTAEMRCSEVKSVNLVRLLKKDLIRKHIYSYDYVAALQVAETMKSGLAPEVMLLLRIAKSRLLLDLATAENLIDKLPEDQQKDIIPVKKEGKELFEYALGLQIKLEKQEYADFIRGITPIVVDLFRIILEKKCGIRLDEYITKKNGVSVWDINKLNGTKVMKALRATFPNFKPEPVYSVHLLPLIKEFSKDQMIARKAEDMRKVEASIRNLAAHEITSITHEKVQKLTGKTPESIMQLIKELMFYAGFPNKGLPWESYRCLNEKLERFIGLSK